MKQAHTPTQPLTETPLLTKAELMAWLKVSRMWVAMQLDNPEFVRRCVVDISTPDSSRRNPRFPARAVAEYLGIPDYATPQITAHRAPAAA